MFGNFIKGSPVLKKIQQVVLISPPPPPQVKFSSLDVHLHTEALLNTITFLSNLLPPSTKKNEVLEVEGEEEKEEEKKEETLANRKKSN